MLGELKTLGEQLVADPGDIRALVLIGDGRAFSSGIDTSVFASDLFAPPDGVAESSAEALDRLLATIGEFQAAFTWCEDARFVTIAAIRGYAVRRRSPTRDRVRHPHRNRGFEARLLELQYGILPDLGGTQRLPRLVGYGKAVELVSTSARIDAAEALRIGLVEEVVADADLEATASALATTIAAQPPLAVQGAKPRDAGSYQLDRVRRPALRKPSSRRRASAPTTCGRPSPPTPRAARPSITAADRGESRATRRGNPRRPSSRAYDADPHGPHRRARRASRCRERSGSRARRRTRVFES